MTEREQVIAELLYLKHDCLEGSATDQTLDKAIAMLKAQEPRVMTLEEVKQWCEIHPHKQNPIWVEFQHGYGTDGWRVGLVNSGILAWCKDNEARCWTSRPDEKTREATPWDAQEQRDYEAAVEMAEYCERYEPTYNADDGSM